MYKQIKLPPLHYKGNEQKKMTLHLFLQIMGKIRLGFNPRKNHWWYVTEYVSTTGITTGPVPYNKGTCNFEITLNVNKNRLEVITSKGQTASFSLLKGIPVAQFYHKLIEILRRFDIDVAIIDKPYDLGINKPFKEITDYHHYDKAYTKAFWQILIWIDSVFKEFSGRFYGKTCPVHLYWHSMDLAVTRFSGNRAPAMPADARLSDKDAYSHECISFGFWGGDENLPEPAFYSYTYPSPNDINKEPLSPDAAIWSESNGSPLAILKYSDLLKETDPRSALLGFLETAYRAGAKKANWDIHAFNVPNLESI